MDFFDAGGIIHEYFVRPMIDPSVAGYNPVNTAVYGILLLASAFYVIYPALAKRGIRFDLSFLHMLGPYILFGISLRVLEDQQILARSANPLDLGFYIFTPGIWILTFVLVMVGLLIGKIVEKKWNIPAQKGTLIFGALVALPVFVGMLLEATEWAGFGIILLLFGGIFLLVRKIANHFRWNFFSHPLAQAAFAGQLLDTSATFTALEFFACGEQHVLPRLLFGAFGNISFFAVKIPLVLIFLYLVNKEYSGKEKDANLLGFILILIAILGFATGGRDALTVLAGTCSP